MARVAEMVDARDLKSLVASLRAGSIPAPGTNKIKGLADFSQPYFLVGNEHCAQNCAHFIQKVI